MKYLIKKLIKKTNQIKCVVGWIWKIQYSSSPTILDPHCGCVKLVCCCCYFCWSFFFFCHAVVFGVLSVPRFVGTQNAVPDSSVLLLLQRWAQAGWHWRRKMDDGSCVDGGIVAGDREWPEKDDDGHGQRCAFLEFFWHLTIPISPTSPRRNDATNAFMLGFEYSNFHQRWTWSIWRRMWCWEAVASAMMHLTVVCAPVCKNKSGEDEGGQSCLQLWLRYWHVWLCQNHVMSHIIEKIFWRPFVVFVSKFG